eukprot:m.313720 g.313720  ORF g.313720 m.313720 type:complete len:51 (+) comp432827_c0_seq1:62-214(+)
MFGQNLYILPYKTSKQNKIQSKGNQNVARKIWHYPNVDIVFNPEIVLSTK